MAREYPTAVALRRALEDRMVGRSANSGISVNRLRKECAYHRLIARFVTVGGPWALKGGVCLLWRIDPLLRGTADVDANWRGNHAALDDFLDRVAHCDLDDGFSFTIGNGRPLQGEVQGGFRFSVLAEMGGREFERFHLDINLTPHDTRLIDQLEVRSSPMAFAPVTAARLTVPVIGLAQQLAEKLHACVRSYAAGEVSSRPKDAFDTVSIARLVAVPNSEELRRVCEATFAYRGDEVPTRPPDLPDRWDAALGALISECPIVVADGPVHLRELFGAFWRAPLKVSQSSVQHFQANTWSWVN